MLSAVGRRYSKRWLFMLRKVTFCGAKGRLSGLKRPSFKMLSVTGWQSGGCTYGRNVKPNAM